MAFATRGENAHAIPKIALYKYTFRNTRETNSYGVLTSREHGSRGAARNARSCKVHGEWNLCMGAAPPVPGGHSI